MALPVGHQRKSYVDKLKGRGPLQRDSDDASSEQGSEMDFEPANTEATFKQPELRKPQQPQQQHLGTTKVPERRQPDGSDKLSQSEKKSLNTISLVAIAVAVVVGALILGQPYEEKDNEFIPFLQEMYFEDDVANLVLQSALESKFDSERKTSEKQGAMVIALLGSQGDRLEGSASTIAGGFPYNSLEINGGNYQDEQTEEALARIASDIATYLDSEKGHLVSLVNMDLLPEALDNLHHCWNNGESWIRSNATGGRRVSCKDVIFLLPLKLESSILSKFEETKEVCSSSNLVADCQQQLRVDVLHPLFAKMGLNRALARRISAIVPLF